MVRKYGGALVHGHESDGGARAIAIQRHIVRTHMGAGKLFHGDNFVRSGLLYLLHLPVSSGIRLL